MSDLIERQAAIDAMCDASIPIVYKGKPSFVVDYLGVIASLPSVSTEKVGTDHWEKIWDKLYNWLNDTRLNVAPDETVKDEIERHERLAQADMLDEVMECMLDLESRREEGEE